ncbi:MAG: hypothetical protein V1876_03955 [Candidatus Peregrinibacteria bacterium]
MRKVWVFNPQAGGKKISPAAQEAVKRRILEHAKRNYSGKYHRIEVRFRGALCYIDAFEEPDVGKEYPTASMGESREQLIDRLGNTPVHLCRLRHFDTDRWTLAFYTYSRERYEPCVFPNGEWFGTREEGFDVGAQYLS